MTASRWLLTWLATALAFASLDAVWLGVVATDFYQGEIGSLMLASPRLLPAAIFYLLYVTAIGLFAIAPAQGRTSQALLRGAALGLVCYGTYDLSNLATLKDWTVRMSVVDMIWGVVATALAAGCGHLASGRRRT